MAAQLPEIKKCPFCGGEGEYHPGQNGTRAAQNTCVRCRVCGVFGPQFHIVEPGGNTRIPNTTKADAIAAWNHTARGVL